MSTFTDEKGVLYTLYDSTHAILGTNQSTTLNAISEDSTLVEYDIPETVNNHQVVAIGKAAFRAYYKFIRITIPSSVTAIYDFAFDCCFDTENYKEKIVIPPNVIHFGYICFSGCFLKQVSISASVKTMAQSPFGHIQNLRFIEVSKENTFFANDRQGALYNKNYTRLITVPRLIKKFSIPLTVKTIDNRCFGETMISYIEIPQNIQSVGYLAFRNNYNLKTIVIRGSATGFEAESISRENVSLTLYYLGIESVSTEIIKNTIQANVFVCSHYEGDRFAGIQPNKIDLCLPPPTAKMTCLRKNTHQLVYSFFG